MLNWCDRHHADYIVGIGKNSRLLKEVDIPMILVRNTQWQMGGKVAETFRFPYQAHAWKYSRWVVARLVEDEQDPNPQFIISYRYDDFKLYYEQYKGARPSQNSCKASRWHRDKALTWWLQPASC
jgi:hypothetical protein